MKKLFALLLALALCLSLAACGGEEGDAPDVTVSDGGPTQEQLQALTDAYNQVATLYNDVATAVNNNGWMADEQVASDIQSIGDVLEPVGLALTGDMSDLEGADFDALPDVLLEFVPVLEEMAAKVAEPYGAEEGMTVVTDEALIPVVNALNEVVPIFNEVYAAAEANGWLADAQTAEELQTVMGTLTFTQSGLTDDPSKLENVEDFNALAEGILQLGSALDEVAARVSVPYGG